METKSSTPDRQPYTTPKLEQHTVWQQTTGVGLSIGTTRVPDFFENIDLVEEIR